VKRHLARAREHLASELGSPAGDLEVET
jgi:hypothetical protein